jgi:hypothetical protein
MSLTDQDTLIDKKPAEKREAVATPITGQQIIEARCGIRYIGKGAPLQEGRGTRYDIRHMEQYSVCQIDELYHSVSERKCPIKYPVTLWGGATAVRKMVLLR